MRTRPEKPGAIYLDWNASAPLDPRVAEVMISSLSKVGNAASAHAYGSQQAGLVDQARAQVAALVAAGIAAATSEAYEVRLFDADFPLPATIPGYYRLTPPDSGQIWARRYPSPRATTAVAASPIRWPGSPIYMATIYGIHLCRQDRHNPAGTAVVFLPLRVAQPARHATFR